MPSLCMANTLSYPAVSAAGSLHSDFQKLEYGLFFFTPNIDNCCYTMALEAMDFIDLYSRNIYPDAQNIKRGMPKILH